MPSSHRQKSPAPVSRISGLQQYTKLENRLVLLAWLNDLLGYTSNGEMLNDTKGADEGFRAEDGHSHLYHRLITRGNKVKIPADDLARYDKNIRVHLEKINSKRTERITLRYFQYLAALYTEIFLDRRFNHRAQLLADLNAFVKENASRLLVEPQDNLFTEADLTKLAYWMATGSGKTLLLHLNYHQFRHYDTESLDNILLITPNEGLSEQHFAELTTSGIPVQRFDLNAGNRRSGSRDVIQVIEITKLKLVEEKPGGGVSVQVDAFEGRNLIFVDEGHKGSGGEAWRKYRDALGAAGFTFEYSATFGQALSAARNDDLTAEYGKAILFDYSYRYFYGDGFGKDFRILNLKKETRAELTELLLLGNLLSFYEQLRIYGEQYERLRPYYLEKPLWVFVGSTVNAVYSEHKEKRSDVLTVAGFLHRVLENKCSWTVEGIEELLAGKNGLVTQEDQYLFASRWPYLREIGLSPQQLYKDILSRIFHTSVGGGLHLCDIRGRAGELGLKAAGADHYFGLIYIGDTAAFKKLVEEDNSGITLEEDALSASLFEDINRADSRIHILIGARKFMEGWNSWRVSNMGLLNIGRHEGSQIIQLFGRGVRLKGKDMRLKRSSALPGQHPEHLHLLETLNIFAVRADYMAQFRDYLEREGVETEEADELRLPTEINEPFLKRGLVIPRPKEGSNFVAEELLMLAADQNISVRVDMTTRVQAIESRQENFQEIVGHTGNEQPIPSESLCWVDWEQVYLGLLAYKERKGLTNLVIRPDTPRKVFQSIKYTLMADEAVVKPRSFAERALLQDAVTNILRKYVDAFYRTRREQWEATKALVYKELDKNDPNLSFNRGLVCEKPGPAYVVKVRRPEKQLEEAIKQLVADAKRLYQQENAGLPRIHFDRHLYLPLLVEQVDKMQSIPPALKPSEAQFVRDLKAYWEAEKDKLLAGKEVFLLRNLSRGSGIGFFEERGFYPDFILWIVDGSGQRIVFIEPHGMLHAKAYIHDEKARLHERLPKLAQEIAQRSHRQDITLDSFIISATPHDELYQRYDDGNWNRARFAEKHILFPERNGEYDYMKKLFTGQLDEQNGKIGVCQGAGLEQPAQQ